jgi:hypothetical protein
VVIAFKDTTNEQKVSGHQDKRFSEKPFARDWSGKRFAAASVKRWTRKGRSIRAGIIAGNLPSMRETVKLFLPRQM